MTEREHTIGVPPWLNWKPGDRIMVERGVSHDHAFEGKTGTVIGITTPHSFVRIQLDGEIGYGTVLVHPESLRART